MNSISLQVLGYVENTRRDLSDDFWGNIESRLHFNSGVLDDDALIGIDTFSHIEVVYFLHQVEPGIFEWVRHPRGLTHLPPVGIMAQRPKSRPNRIGLSRCRLMRREKNMLTVLGLDAVDGTPILDIKPWYASFGPQGSIVEPAWVEEIMKNYYK